MLTEVECPHCHKNFELTDVLTASLRTEMSKELMAEANSLANEAALKLKEVATKEAEIIKANANISAEIEKGVNARLIETKETIRTEVRQEFTKESAENKGKLDSVSERLNEAQKREEAYIKTLEDLRGKVNEKDLDIQRAVSEASEKLRKENEEKTRTKDGQHNLEMRRLKEQLEDATRKIEQRSTEVQGEAAEIDLVDSLRLLFPHDTIEDVPKGVRGADCIQRVINLSGKEAGSILWERKRTKNFQEAWIQKLKDDVTHCKAHVGIILTDVLPKEIQGGFDSYKGVWLCGNSDFMALAKALRGQLISGHALIKAQEGKQSQGESLIDYVTSPLFKQRIEAVSETFKSMHEQIQAEKRAMNRIWSAREGHIDRVFTALSGLAGDIEGKIEKNLGIETFELKALPETSEK